MARIELSRKENVEGAFFVDSSCIDCDQCRQIAPEVFTQAGEQSAVTRQPANADEELAALKALITCPTASIGTHPHRSATVAVAAYPELVDGTVYFCGFAAESSFGASSYLVVRPAGNVLIDSPRFVKPLVERVRNLGGIRWLFLTHRDDVADQESWAHEFGAQRVMHRADLDESTSGVEHVVDGLDAVALDDELQVIPTPGHTAGHCVLRYRAHYLFTGDHLWWSPERKSLHASRSVCWHSWPEQVDSLRRLRDFPFGWVLPGHGHRFHASAPEMRRHLDSCIRRVTQKN